MDAYQGIARHSVSSPAVAHLPSATLMALPYAYSPDATARQLAPAYTPAPSRPAPTPHVTPVARPAKPSKPNLLSQCLTLLCLVFFGFQGLRAVVMQAVELSTLAYNTVALESLTQKTLQREKTIRHDIKRFQRHEHTEALARELLGYVRPNEKLIRLELAAGN